MEGKSYFCTVISPQEAREGSAVPDRARLCARHARGGRAFPAAEEGAQPADDRGVPGQSAEAVQQGRAGVSMGCCTCSSQTC